MQFARHEARLRQPVSEKDRTPVGAHYQELASRGNASAIAALLPPPFPIALTSLWQKFERLDGMREVGQYGPLRFTPAHIKAACDLFGWQLTPQDVEALVALDVVMLYPDAGQD